MTFLKLKSLKTSIFLIIFFSSLVSLIILSCVTINMIDKHIEENTEEKFLAYTYAGKNLYESYRTDLLNNGLIISKVISTQNLDVNKIKKLIEEISRVQGLDIVILIDKDGKVISRANNNKTNDTVFYGGLANLSINNKIAMVSEEIISVEELTNENPKFLLDTYIKRVSTIYGDTEKNYEYEREGLAIVATIPIIKENEVISVLILADILNSDYKISDKIIQTLNLDTSIYMKDVVVSTTKKTKKQNRLIGTLLFKDVLENLNKTVYVIKLKILDEILNQVYFPLKNHEGIIIGALSFEISNDKINEGNSFINQKSLIKTIFITTLILILISFFIAYNISKKFTDPINQLVESSNELIDGNFEQGVKIDSYEEINELANTFNRMIRSIRKKMVLKERNIIEEMKKMKDDK